MTDPKDLCPLYDEAVRQVNVQVNTIHDLEAARDHLRARLPSVVAQLRHAYQQLANDTGGGWGHYGRQQFAEGLIAPQIRTLEDLLAVLTEPPQEEKKESHA